MFSEIPWSHKCNDFLAAGVGGTAIAVLQLESVEAWLQIAVLALTIVFLLFGIAMRAERFVVRMSRAFLGEPIAPPAEVKEDEDER